MNQLYKTSLWLTICFSLLLAACQPGQPPGTQSPASEAPYPPPSPTFLPGNDFYPEPSSVISPTSPTNRISWEEAKQLILAGNVAQVMQAHSLEVHLVLKDGRELTTIEPGIDDVFDVVDQCGEVCKDIILATE